MEKLELRNNLLTDFQCDVLAGLCEFYGYITPTNARDFIQVRDLLLDRFAKISKSDDLAELDSTIARQESFMYLNESFEQSFANRAMKLSYRRNKIIQLNDKIKSAIKSILIF